MPDKVGRLSEQEKIFIDRYAATGDRIYSAEKAGYSQPSASAAKLLSRPAVQSGVAEQVERLRDGNIIAAHDLARQLLVGAHFPVMARVAAMKAVMADYGRVEDARGDARDPADMSVADLTRRIQQLRALSAEYAQPILDMAPDDVALEDDADVLD